MKQYEAVLQTLEKLGGQATLAQLYIEVMKIKECEWKTKTPFASIRRIVQTRPEIFKVRPGLWALHAYKTKLGLVPETPGQAIAENEQDHSYYQGLIAAIGNMRGFNTYIPNQDRNKKFVGKPLSELRTLEEIPHFSHDQLVHRSASIDVIWFNGRLMPNSLFEVEHSTDFQNSLLKFNELQDFNTRMVIVAHIRRKPEFTYKLNFSALRDIRDRVKFLDYDQLILQYEHEMRQASQSFII